MIVKSDYAARMSDLPASLRFEPTFPFVGRSAELERLQTLVPWAEGEGRRVVLLGGEPGSGKSRLVRTFAADVAREDVLVIYGACDAVVHTPYGPFVEALGPVVRTTEPAALRAALGDGGGELIRLFPDLPARVVDLPPPVEADPDTERHRLHIAVTNLLAGITRRWPALLVLEDCHWADAATLLLLRHLARAGGEARILLVATFRDTEVDVPATLADTLADLRRLDDVVRLHLAGLSEGEVAEFVERAAGGERNQTLSEAAQTIYNLTEGNPFLLCELWRELAETGSVSVTGGALRVARPPEELGSPDSVREVVNQRLSRLQPQAIDVLELAATAGSEFELDLIRRAAGLDRAGLLGALDEGVRGGMIEELPSRRFAFRFTHELMRRALYDRLSKVRRAELHLRVAEALDETAPRSGRQLADLAHHFASAAPLGDPDRAVEYNILAAQAAIASLAFDQAASRLRTALELGVNDPEKRGDVLLRLGDACHRGGELLPALEAFRSAAEIARQCGDVRVLARAAMGYEEACWRPGIVDPVAAGLLEEAAATLGDEDSELLVGVLSGLARSLDRQGERKRGEVIRTRAITMARRLGDRVGLATTLARSYWARGTTPLKEILGMLSEAALLADELDNAELRVETMAWRTPTFVALFDLESARSEAARQREISEQTAQPFYLHVAEHYRSAIAVCDGRLVDAEMLAHRSHEWSRLLTGRDASGIYGIQMFTVRREQGRLAELAPVIRILAGQGREGPWRPGLVALLVELGMYAEGRRELSRFVAHGLDPFRESLWLGSLAYLTDACAALGDETAAALVYPEFERYAGGNVMIGHLVACYGAADRYLGMLATTLGEWELAVGHFERALELNRRTGAITWVAHTAFEYARCLLARGRRDRTQAAALLGEAVRLAERIGMPVLLGRIRAIGVPAPGPGLPDGLSKREAEILGLVARGLSNREIGGALFISEHTAANHIRSILQKTGCTNRTEAASYAHRHGLVTV